MAYNFSNKEKSEIVKLFEDGMILSEIGKIFGCSLGRVRGEIINSLGKEKYKKIAKEHSSENSRKIGLKTIKKAQEVAHKLPKNKNQIEASRENIKKAQEVAHKLPRNENQLEASRENGRKMGKVYGSENFKKAIKASQINHPSIYEKQFKRALENKNIFFEWQKIINFPKESFIKFCIVDFFINSKIIVEIDGWSHNLDPSYDKERDKICKKLGFEVLRFTHDEIQNNLENCIEKIK